VAGKPSHSCGRGDGRIRIEKTKKRARDHRYDTSEKGRERHRRYNQSRKGLERNQRYEDSEKGRTTRWQWLSENDLYLMMYRTWRHRCAVSERLEAAGHSPLAHLERPDPPSVCRERRVGYNAAVRERGGVVVSRRLGQREEV
jgi:hypothetical protein